MVTRHQPVPVGSPNPDAKTSPILEERSEDHDFLALELDELPVCYFNNTAYQDGTYVCSGSGALLHCEKGLWVRAGGCDPDNP